MDDLIAFLRACESEREERAHEASFGGTGEWYWEPGRGYEVGSFTAGDAIPFVVCREARPGVDDDEQLAHIAANDPAFVLADIAAKRPDYQESWKP